MGNSASQYSEYRSINEAHEAVQIILRENPSLSYEAQSMLQDLRTDIFQGLDGERSARIQIYVKDENNGNPFNFMIGRGKQHLIVHIKDDEIAYGFATGRYLTKFRRGAARFFKTIVRVTAGGLLSGAHRALTW